MSELRFHVIERTSPKGPGQKFVGTCRFCGMKDLPASAVLEPCENWRGVSQNDALLEALNGTVQS